MCAQKHVSLKLVVVYTTRGEEPIFRWVTDIWEHVDLACSWVGRLFYRRLRLEGWTPPLARLLTLVQRDGVWRPLSQEHQICLPILTI